MDRQPLAERPQHRPQLHQRSRLQRQLQPAAHAARPVPPLGDWAQFLNQFTKATPTAPKDDDVHVLLLPRSKGSLNLLWRNAAGWSASLNATYTRLVRNGATPHAATYTALGQPDYLRVIDNNGALACARRAAASSS